MSNNTERLPGLLSEHPILLYPSLARMFGSSDHAIIFQQLYFLLSITEKVKSKYNEIDGKWWVYNSYLEWHKEHFPWLSTSTIQRCFLRLEQAGIVESMQSVKYKSDRRKWYTINETEYKVLYEKWENADPSYQNDVMVEHIKLRRCNVANCDDGYTETTTENTKEKKTLSPQVQGDGDSDSDNASKCADESPVTELLPKEQQLTPDMAEVLADTPFMATIIIGNTHAKQLNGMIKDGLIDYNNPQTKMLVPTAKGHAALQAYRTQQYTLEDCMNDGDSTLCGYIDPNGERLQCNDCYGLGVCHLARQESTVVDVEAQPSSTIQYDSSFKVCYGHNPITGESSLNADVVGIDPQAECFDSKQFKGFQKGTLGQVLKKGYVLILKPEHPHALYKGYIKRANFVWEQVTGHYPQKSQVIHHKDSDKLNDEFDNLQLMDSAEHNRMHIEESNWKGEGHPGYKHGKYVGDWNNRQPGRKGKCQQCGKQGRKLDDNGLCFKSCVSQQVVEEIPAPKAKKPRKPTINVQILHAIYGAMSPPWPTEGMNYGGLNGKIGRNLRKWGAAPEDMPGYVGWLAGHYRKQNYNNGEVELGSYNKEANWRKYQAHVKQLKAQEVSTEEDSPQPLSALEGIVRGKEL